MHSAILYQKLYNKIVLCYLCPWNCKITDGHYGFCMQRKNVDGELKAAGYGQIASIAADPIEKKPLFNFYPGTKVMSVGALGCNLCCLHCQNWEISQVRQTGAMRETHYLSPEDLIAYTKQYNCKGIAWTYNEPSINIEYAIDGAKLAKEAGLYTVFVTNGYITEEGLDAIGPYLDAYNVDIKGLDDFYKNVAGVKGVDPVFAATKRAKDKWQIHVEVTTNVIPTVNDSEDTLTTIAQWILNNLGAETPWHISRFFPQYKLGHLPPTPEETLVQARAIGLRAGLTYVYTGNLPGDTGENTYCPKCGKILIERQGYHINQLNLEGRRCSHCKSEVAITR